MKDYTIVDIETTGLSRHAHRITEIAAVRFKGRRQIGEFKTLVNPECRIPSFITNLTGINNDMVKDAPTIDKVLPEFIDFLGSSVIVAHNASFDYGFISHNAQKHLKVDLENKRLCTRKLANRLLPDLPSKKLSCVCEELGIENERAHRAMGDVKATAAVFEAFLELMKEQEITKEEHIFDFEKSLRGKNF